MKKGGEKMEYIPIQCKSAIRKVRGGMPYQHDVNIYRGCELDVYIAMHCTHMII